MKKIISLTLALIMLLTSALVFASCGDNDDVTTTEEEKYKIPASHEKAVENLDAKGYEIMVETDTMLSELEIDFSDEDGKAEAIIQAKTTGDNVIIVIYLDSESRAKEIVVKLEQYLQEQIEQLNEAFDDKNDEFYKAALEELESLIIGRNGKVAFVGAPQAVTDIQ